MGLTFLFQQGAIMFRFSTQVLHYLCELHSKCRLGFRVPLVLFVLLGLLHDSVAPTGTWWCCPCEKHEDSLQAGYPHFLIVGLGCALISLVMPLDFAFSMFLSKKGKLSSSPLGSVHLLLLGTHWLPCCL